MSIKALYYCLDMDTNQVWSTEIKPYFNGVHWATLTAFSWQRVAPAELEMIGEIKNGECWHVIYEYNGFKLTN